MTLSSRGTRKCAVGVAVQSKFMSVRSVAGSTGEERLVAAVLHGLSRFEQH